MQRILLLIIAICSILGFVCLILLHPYFNGKNPIISYAHHLVWGNVIELKVTEPLNQNEVTAIFLNEGALLKRRTPPITYKDFPIIEDTIIAHGKQIRDIPYDYGKQVLSVFYRDSMIGEIFMWKTNGYHSHRYSIEIFQQNDSIKFIGDFEGPDKEFYRR